MIKQLINAVSQFLQMCRNIRIKFLSWAYMYTILKFVGKHVIQTNPQERERDISVSVCVFIVCACACVCVCMRACVSVCVCMGAYFPWMLFKESPTNHFVLGRHHLNGFIPWHSKPSYCVAKEKYWLNSCIPLTQWRQLMCFAWQKYKLNGCVPLTQWGQLMCCQGEIQIE